MVDRFHYMAYISQQRTYIKLFYYVLVRFMALLCSFISLLHLFKYLLGAFTGVYLSPFKCVTSAFCDMS